ncbi:hypothetical protein T484DRAFT_3257330 [Baffinella frigidus]|nr:hypothetical protein T484DRAFT_3257330 [Cryptophyta sp. CCMP2293]
MELPGYTLVFSREHGACEYAGRREALEGMCGAPGGGAAAAGTSPPPPRLPGTPVVAYAVNDGRAGSVLVGIVTGQPAGNADLDVIARVSAARQWILAATGTGIFPAVKLLTRVDTFNGGAALRVHQGPSEAYQGVPVGPCEAGTADAAVFSDAGTGAVRATLSALAGAPEVVSLMGDVSLVAHNLIGDGVPHVRLSTWKVGCARNFNVTTVQGLQGGGRVHRSVARRHSRVRVLLGREDG